LIDLVILRYGVLNKTAPMMLLSHGYWALLFALCVDANDNGLGRTPQMGWNSWNHFHCDIHEDLIHDIAHAAVDLGLKDAGYSYINLDDCWQISRDDDGYIQEDPDAFPSGIPALSDYVHSLGLKFGLYSDAGTNTCQRRPGSLGTKRKMRKATKNGTLTI
jgi:alpha-galactosidase